MIKSKTEEHPEIDVVDEDLLNSPKKSHMSLYTSAKNRSPIESPDNVSISNLNELKL